MNKLQPAQSPSKLHWCLVPQEQPFLSSRSCTKVSGQLSHVLSKHAGVSDSAMPLPRALRVLHLPDRLVLHDISHALRGDPSDRNSLIDAANDVHSRALSAVAAEQPSLLDLDLPKPPPASSTSRDRYLVLPFSTAGNEDPAPYSASSPEQAGLPVSVSGLHVDAAAGLLGLIRLLSGRYVVLATQVRRAGALPSGAVYAVSKVRLVPLHVSPPSKDDRDLPAAIVKLLESGAVYYSTSADLTRATSNSARRRPADLPNAFWWTWPLVANLGRDAESWALRTMYGFVGTNIMRFQSSAMPTGAGDFRHTLVSRRSRRRAGTRYITRGVDAMGDVANFVETEQVVWNDERPEAYSSFVIIRGSVPVFWRQNNGIARPVPELDGSLTASRTAFAAHFKDMCHSYGGVTAVSLVDKKGSESVLADAFERHFELDLPERDAPLGPKLVAFDFHSHCAGKEYERGLSLLMDQLQESIALYGFFATGLDATGKNGSQMGVFRVNCVDCLDRTNVVQSMISRVALNMQLAAIFSPELLGAKESAAPRLYGESEDRFKHVWGDNADAVSKQYSGTGALKTDFTRTGKRSTTGVIGDGVKSVMRMYYKTFVDEGRQEVIDVLCGNAVIRPPAQLTGSRAGLQENGSSRIADAPPRSPVSKDIWYSFEAIRVNASGDKQPVLVELHDESMHVTTNEGISLDYPRRSLLSWSKYEDGKTSDKKSTVRLRLVYRPSRKAPATTSPLDLQFRGGTTARENFLRAVVSWAKPDIESLLRKQDLRVRTLAAVGVGEHRMRDWGLGGEDSEKNEIVALIVPEGNSVTRSWGLGAVPTDVDESNFVLVSACAVSSRGPSIAILASRGVAPTVMNISESISGRAATFAAGGAIAVALEACGTSMCFVSAKLGGPQDVYHSLTALKLGRSTFDATNQYHHFVLAGLLGDMQWYHDSAPATGPSSRKWVRLGDGSSCYSLANGLSVMRNSFPSLRYEDMLHRDSFWNQLNSSTEPDGPRICAVLTDGVVDGRPGPRLSRSVSHCVVTIDQLRGEEIKSPPGIDANAQLNSIIVLHCDYATVDGASTRQTQRLSSFPEWRESLHLIMMPSDPDELYDAFIVGQIAILTPLADPVPAGHFVIPMSYAADTPAEFNVPCRLAGIPTGRLIGRIGVEFGGKELIERLGQQQLQARSTRGSRADLGPRERNGLPSVPSSGGLESSLQSAGSDALRKAKTMGSKVSSFSSGRLQKPNMEEVNKNLDAARKKGSKQIKSMVGKLSSLLNQPASSSIAPQPANLRDSELDRSTQRNSSEQGYNEVFEDFDPQPRGTQRSTAERNMQTGGVSQGLGGAGGGRRASSSNGGSRSGGGGASLLDLDDDDGGFGSFQQAAAGQNSRAGVGAEDALLSGLQSSLSHAARAGSQRTVPVHARAGSDDLLLSGLASQRNRAKARSESKAGAEDDWGEFQGAG